MFNSIFPLKNREVTLNIWKTRYIVAVRSVHIVIQRKLEKTRFYMKHCLKSVNQKYVTLWFELSKKVIQMDPHHSQKIGKFLTYIDSIAFVLQIKIIPDINSFFLKLKKYGSIRNLN